MRNIRTLNLASARPHSLARFAVVGTFAACVDFSTFNAVLLALGPSRVNVLVANTAAFAAVLCVSYFLNARFTFRAARSRLSFARYFAVALVGVAIYDSMLMLLMTQVDPADTLRTNLAKAVAVIPSATWNFVGFARFAFGGRPVRADAGRGATRPLGPREAALSDSLTEAPHGRR